MVTRVIINMTTIATRKQRYIDRTVESLFKSDGGHLPLNLILGSDDTSQVEQYQNAANLVLWDEISESRSTEGQSRRNCVLNAIRALKYGDDDYCVCCEDDILFDQHWYRDLMATIAQIECKNYVLNLGQGVNEASERRFVVHTGRFLLGAQGIFYPNKVLRDRIARYVERNMTRGVNDFLIGKYAKDFLKLYNTVPNLIQHIGEVSNFLSETQPQGSSDGSV